MSEPQPAGRLETDDGSDSTAHRILDTAEQLFADQGFHATTLRQITREAGVNLAAVNYHHGSKDALILAVFQRRLDELNSERLARLNAALASGDPPRLEDVLEAFIHPALRMGSDSSGDGGRFMRLLMRAWAENATQLHRVIRRQYSHVMRTFADAVSRSLGTAPENLRQQLDFLIGALTYTMAETGNDDVEAKARALIRFGCAGLRDSIAPTTTMIPPSEDSPS
jgi:AcrR family transcriptional regulator